MSIHLITCAAKLRIKPSAKLVLLCMAESARDEGRLAWPGAEALMQWAGVSRPRLFAILKELDELRLVKQTKRGQKYQRAEYIVFPDGCCDVHSALSGRDAESPVESLDGKTLNDSQGLVFDPQGLVSNRSASRQQDPSRTTSLIHLPEVPTSPTSPERVVKPAPPGVFDEVRAKLAGSQRRASA